MTDDSRYLTNLGERRARRRWLVRITIFATLIIALGGGTWWLLFRSPVYQVDQIVVEGTVRLSADDIEARAEKVVQQGWLAGILGTHHMLVWPEGELAAVSDELPLLRSLTVKRDYHDHRVTLMASEREPYGVWCLENRDPVMCYWVDATGYVLEPAPKFEGNIVSTIADYATNDLAEGTFVPPAGMMANVVSIFHALAASGIGVREVRYEHPERQELTVTTYLGPNLLFSMRFPATATAPALLDLLAKDSRGELTPRFRDLQYVDFRVENRVYYK
jgi:hypothetical protein